jgi:hypothetical protein
MIHVDLHLTQRIERIAALNQAADARMHAQLHLDSRATSHVIGDGIATFVRADWPINTAIGLGLANVGQSDQLDEVEAFYAPVGAAPRVVVCPFTDRDLLQQLGRRGYYVAQFMNVHPRLITPDDGREPAPHEGIIVTQATPEQTNERARRGRHPSPRQMAGAGSVGHPQPVRDWPSSPPRRAATRNATCSATASTWATPASRLRGTSSW